MKSKKPFSAVKRKKLFYIIKHPGLSRPLRRKFENFSKEYRRWTERETFYVLGWDDAISQRCQFPKLAYKFNVSQ